MNAKEKKCWKFGHDWAYNFDNAKGGWIYAKCLRCDAEQLFFVDEENEPDMDDDRPEEQDEQA